MDLADADLTAESILLDEALHFRAKPDWLGER
jgi:hypothetical protein